KILIILSGPEPRRTFLEKEMLKQAAKLNEKFVLVQGLTTKEFSVEEKGNVTIYPFLFGEQLNEMLESSEIIVTRSGYTTVMDLYALGKKTIMIPTPGQSEQVYLAEHLHTLPQFVFVEQKNFRLSELIEELRSRPQPEPQKINDGLHRHLAKTLQYF